MNPQWVNTSKLFFLITPFVHLAGCGVVKDILDYNPPSFSDICYSSATTYASDQEDGNEKLFQFPDEKRKFTASQSSTECKPERAKEVHAEIDNSEFFLGKIYKGFDGDWTVLHQIPTTFFTYGATNYIYKDDIAEYFEDISYKRTKQLHYYIATTAMREPEHVFSVSVAPISYKDFYSNIASDATRFGDLISLDPCAPIYKLVRVSVASLESYLGDIHSCHWQIEGKEHGFCAGTHKFSNYGTQAVTVTTHYQSVSVTATASTYIEDDCP